jgi:hypothetical protein
MADYGPTPTPLGPSEIGLGYRSWRAADASASPRQTPPVVYKGRSASIDGAQAREIKAQGMGTTEIAKAWTSGGRPSPGVVASGTFWRFKRTSISR